MRMYNISNHPVETSFKFNFKGFGGFREATGRVLGGKKKKKKSHEDFFQHTSFNTRVCEHVLQRALLLSPYYSLLTRVTIERTNERSFFLLRLVQPYFLDNNICRLW